MSVSSKLDWRPLVRSTVLVGTIAAVMAACSGKGSTGPSGPTPSAIALLSGDGQSGTVGQALSQPVVVRVTDKSGSGVSGVSVSWAVTTGGGSLSAGSVTTDGQGQASVNWTLGTAAGTGNNRVTASVSGLTGSPITFTASANAGPASQLVAVSGDHQAATVGQSLPLPVVVAAKDQYGNATSGVTINWAAGGGEGNPSALSNATNAQGQASVTWTLGITAGSSNDTLRASAGGLAGSPVTFTASANPAAATQLALLSGNNQTDTVGQALAQPLIVIARDQYNNPVSGVTVNWAITAGGGNVSANTAMTDPQGQASVSWTLGPTAGAQSASASAAGLAGSPVAFAASAQPGPAATIAAVSGNNQTARVDSVLPNPFVVKVTDAYANAIAGTAVTWAVTGGNGSITPLSSITNSAGQTSATMTTGTTAGTNKDTATATVVGLTGSPVSFTASATPGPAMQLALAGGNNQSALAGTALPNPYSVKATDSFGNSVSGVTVDWAVTSGSGSITPAQDTTDATGLASATHTLGSTAGTQTATATSSGLTGSPVGFTATAQPNAVISGVITLAAGFLAPPALASGVQRIGAAGPTLQRPPSAGVRALRSSPTVGTVSKANSITPQYTPDELLVTYRSAALQAPPIGSPALSTAAAALSFGAAIRARLQPTAATSGFAVVGVVPAILTARIKVQDPARLPEVQTLLRADPAVLAVDRNALVYADDYWLPHDQVPPVRQPRPASTSRLPGDPLYPWQAWHYGMIDLPSAWDITTGATSVLVAVVDKGIRFDHPAIAANLTSDGYDFVTDQSVPACGGGFVSNAGDGDDYDPDPTIPADYEMDPINNCANGLASSGAHGLHVAGTIGAVGNDGVGVTGVNWNVRIRPVRVLGTTGSGTEADVINGILYAAGLPVDTGSGGPPIQAASAARIINLSLGAPAASMAESLAVVSAKNAGVLLIASAGNDHLTAPGYPAAFPEVLSVAAVGPDFNLASYSNYAGPNGVAAPGGDLADGDASFGIMSTAWNFQTNTPIYDASSWNGTSMAAPHVSGIAALLLAQDPSLTADQLRARLTGYAFDFGATGQDNAYGFGLVNARNSLTQSSSPPRNLYARLYNATTGATVQTVPVAGNGSYAFNGLADGDYYVFAGLDQSGDQQVGVPDPGFIARAWGAFGGTSTPTTVTVAGAGTYPASFSIALPIEVETNNTIASPDALPVGGYINGVISDPSTDQDVYRVIIPQAGQYTFETSGYVGACGFALEEDTILGLYDVSGTLITSNDNIDAPNLNFCSRITATLNPGTYYIGVFGNRGGDYTLQARSGS